MVSSDVSKKLFSGQSFSNVCQWVNKVSFFLTCVILLVSPGYSKPLLSQIDPGDFEVQVVRNLDWPLLPKLCICGLSFSREHSTISFLIIESNILLNSICCIILLFPVWIIIFQVGNLWDLVPAEAGDRFLSMLPTWHAYERAGEYFIFTRGIEQVYTTVRNLKVLFVGRLLWKHESSLNLSWINGKITKQFWLIRYHVLLVFIMILRIAWLLVYYLFICWLYILIAL